MNQITLTLDATPENLELLKQFTERLDSTPPQKITTAVQESASAPAPQKTVQLSDVRAIALKLSKAGKQDVLKSAFAKFGGKKLSDISESDYPALWDALIEEVPDDA